MEEYTGKPTPDLAEAKRQKRLLKNRASAKRSRKRKDDQLIEVRTENKYLKDEIDRLLAALNPKETAIDATPSGSPITTDDGRFSPDIIATTHGFSDYAPGEANETRTASSPSFNHFDPTEAHISQVELPFSLNSANPLPNAGSDRLDLPNTAYMQPRNPSAPGYADQLQFPIAFEADTAFHTIPDQNNVEQWEMFPGADGFLYPLQADIGDNWSHLTPEGLTQTQGQGLFDLEKMQLHPEQAQILELLQTREKAVTLREAAVTQRENIVAEQEINLSAGELAKLERAQQKVLTLTQRLYGVDISTQLGLAPEIGDGSGKRKANINPDNEQTSKIRRLNSAHHRTTEPSASETEAATSTTYSEAQSPISSKQSSPEPEKSPQAHKGNPRQFNPRGSSGLSL